MTPEELKTATAAQITAALEDADNTTVELVKAALIGTLAALDALDARVEALENP